jgi:hypothetical protein
VRVIYSFLINRKWITPIVISILVSFLATFTPTSYAIFGGSSATGDQRVVALINGQDNIRSGCSGSLIEPQIVVAAAHCLGNPNLTYTSEIYEPKDLWIAQPGADLNLDDINSRAQVLRVVLTKGYNNTFEPEKGNNITQKDDIAFFFLEKPLVSSYSVPIADKDDIRLIKDGQYVFTHIGYGLIDQNKQDGKAYTTQLKSYSVGASRYPGHPALEEKTVTSQEVGTNALCGGDSGSPWFTNVKGVEKIVAVSVAASGCRGTGSGLGGTLGTIIYPYLYLVDSHWKQFLEDLPLRLKSAGLERPDESLPLIQRSGGCDAKVSAVLQISNQGQWVDFAQAQGWKRIPNCPESNPYQPWVRAKVENGSLLRWHIWAPGTWDFWTEPFAYIEPAPTTTPKPIDSPQPLIEEKLPEVKIIKEDKITLGLKKTTISCKKGKLIKKITAVKPLCPSGYKKR